MRSDEQLYNVRCCCTPDTIYGTIPGPKGAWRFKVRELEKAPTHWHHIAADPIAYDDSQYLHEVRVEPLSVKSEWGRYKERAVYSDDRPIEFWRKIAGFKEGEEVIHEAE